MIRSSCPRGPSELPRGQLLRRSGGKKEDSESHTVEVKKIADGKKDPQEQEHQANLDTEEKENDEKHRGADQTGHHEKNQPMSERRGNQL